MKRRSFLRRATLSTLAAGTVAPRLAQGHPAFPSFRKTDGPVILSTWAHGVEANAEAWRILEEGGSVLDAVEKGVMVTEADPKNQSVGIGGLPDRDGRVTLDASIMGPDGNCGSVVYLEHIKHPICVARKVMEDTPHVMMAGEGALALALDMGMEKENLLTEDSEKAWKKWLEKSQYKPIINIENHDTIGLLAIDDNGDIAGACTTSGLAYKMNGRVGDSPIIGSGLYVDNAVGGAVCTGLGEEVIKSVASFLAVEKMRDGASPQEACQIAIDRIMEKSPHYKDFQVGIIALNKSGEIGSYAIHPYFNYAHHTVQENVLIDSKSAL